MNKFKDEFLFVSSKILFELLPTNLCQIVYSYLTTTLISLDKEETKELIARFLTKQQGKLILQGDQFWKASFHIGHFKTHSF
jgi:hypothetical protein